MMMVGDVKNGGDAVGAFGIDVDGDESEGGGEKVMMET